MILQSLVKSADKNLDGAMDWKEFEGFGDFELVLYQRWPQMWRILRDDMLSDMNTCAGGGEGSCFPSAWTTEDLKRWLQLVIPPFLCDQHIFRYFSKQEVITRLVQNLFFHEDLQFPSWTLQD